MFLILFGLAGSISVLSSCVTGSGSTSGEMAGGDASSTAKAIADKAVVQPVVYENAGQQGPALVVLPGQFKISNATFTQKFTPNNIADFAELELDKANFKVLERGDLGPLLQEVVLAVNMGDPEGLRKFRKGKFVTTRWFLQFDVLKAEPVAEAGTEFDGKAIGNIVTAIAGDNLGGRVAGGVIASAGGSEDAKIWIIGLRYKIIDASDSVIVKTGYVEDKMEVGASSASFLGIKQTEKGGMTIDSMVQRLVQKCVAEIDKVKGMSPALVKESKSQEAAVEGRTVVADKSPKSAESMVSPQVMSAYSEESVEGKRVRQKKSETIKPQVLDTNANCQDLRKEWQLGDSSVMERYLRECAK
ncbi:MAG: hypothetical protein OEL83_17640 [Desulforhopalus sp.]|nr:hypothetical protein [Desulforhopalus sp.]